MMPLGEEQAAPIVLAATKAGCVVLAEGGERAVELEGRTVFALAREEHGACVAVVDGCGIWRRSASAQWSQIGNADVELESILAVGGTVYVGAITEAALMRLDTSGKVERLPGFDRAPGRSEWYAGGPPLSVRSLATTADRGVLMAAVHVGGIPRSTDGGETWIPTIPIDYDVHEVRPHLSEPIVAAASAVGLLVSRDAGANWAVVAEGLAETYSLAVGFLGEEILFSVQDGPFAGRSQIWRRRLAGGPPEQVREGLPEWLSGKVDTAHIAISGDRVAVIDGGGDFWLSKAGSRGWERIAGKVADVHGVLML